MKRTRAFTTIALAALLAMGSVAPMAMAAHTPLPGIEACPTSFPLYAPQPTFAQAEVGSAVTAWPVVGTYDFCGQMDTVICQLNGLSGLIPEVVDYANLLRCFDADINGPVNPDPGEDELPITPNGVPDGQYELAIVDYVLNNASHSLHTQTMAAFQYNFVNIKNLVQQALQTAGYLGLLPMFGFNYTIPGLSMLLAGYATLGDPTTNAALDMLLELLADIGLEPPEGGIAAITQSVPALGPYGDVDGDGSSNMTEYTHFVVGNGYSAAQYIAAVFDPNQAASAPDPVITGVSGNGRKAIGSDIEIVPITKFLTNPISYEWTKNGEVLTDQTSSTLVIQNAQESDSGYYTVTITYEIEEKATGTISTGFWIVVGDFSDLPATSGLGILALSGLLAVAGAIRYRKRK